MTSSEFMNELKSQLHRAQVSWAINARALETQLGMGGEELISKDRKKEFYDLKELCKSYKCVISYNEEKESDNKE